MDFSLLLTGDGIPGSDGDRYARTASRQQSLYDALRAAILDGRIGHGVRLPATRALASELGIARNTVLYAYERLMTEGLLEATRQGTVAAYPGLTTMSSGFASVRDGDGFCTCNQLYLSARDCCPRFTPRVKEYGREGLD